MPDSVQTLRAWEAMNRAADPAVADDCKAMADEIERLRATLAAVPAIVTDMRTSGSWDDATLRRVLEILPAVFKNFDEAASPNRDTESANG